MRRGGGCCEWLIKKINGAASRRRWPESGRPASWKQGSAEAQLWVQLGPKVGLFCPCQQMTDGGCGTLLSAFEKKRALCQS
jgi:hypothetical protein